jgi:Family of unknown function (DUF6644)
LSLLAICQWLEKTPLGSAIRQSPWLFSGLVAVHTLGIILTAGTISLVDLRLLGIGLRREPVSNVLAQILPWTWTGFVLMFTTGALLFCSEAVMVFNSVSFRIKMALILLAGLNALIFHKTVYRGAPAWKLEAATPSRARLSALLSLTLWIGIVSAGRAIAYEIYR